MKAAIGILFGAIFTGLVCLNLGELALLWLKAKLTRPELRFFGFMLGAALLSLAMFVLACLHLVYWPVLLLLGVAVIGLRYRVPVEPTPHEELPAAPRVWQGAFWCVYLAFGAYYLVAAMAPEMSPDGAGYHLGFVRRYYQHRGFTAETSSMLANIPAGVEMLFLFAYSFGRHSAAAMVHLLFLLALPFGMIYYARREGHPSAGVFGALLCLVAPVVGKDATCAYNDVALAAVMFASFSSLRLWAAKQERGLLVLSGALAGFACAIKYTGLPALLYVLGAVCFMLFRERRKLRRDIVTLAVVAGVMFVPWLVKNLVITGNPVYPFLNHYFPNPYFYESIEKILQAGMATMNGVTLPQLPLEVTLKGQLLCGLIGPVFLLAPVALLALRWRAGRHLLVMSALCLAFYFSNIGTRFLIPCLPFVSLALGFVLTSVPGLGLIVVAAHVLLSWPAVVPRYAAEFAWRFEGLDWRAALRLTPQDEYLRKHFGDYQIGRELNRHMAPGDRVFCFLFEQLAYHDREIVNGWRSSLGKRTFDMFRAVLLPDEHPIWQRRLSFPALQAERIRVELTGSVPMEWQVHELRLFDAGTELPRAPHWRLKASANPWEIPFAFDNSPVTRWSSARFCEPGLSIEVDLGSPSRLSAVELTVAPFQKDLPLAVRAETGGQWRALSTTETTRKVADPKSLRRTVMREIRQSGIGWFLVRDEDFGAADLVDRASSWGITQVAFVDGYRLFRID